MIFKNIDIHSFGKLSGKSLQLYDSLNVIYGKNESGKSTISEFIEAMLYSYPPRDTGRKKYIPWDKDFSSGSITLSHNGEDITVFRQITPSPARDKVEIIPPRELNFIPHDRETYRKTVYCKEAMASDFGKTDEIEQKISNILLTGDEGINASAAIERLEAFRKTIKPKKGNGGKLNETLNKITLLEEELHRAKQVEATQSKNERELVSLQSELDSLTKKRNSLLSEPQTEFSDTSGEITALEKLISSLPDGTHTPPRLKLSLWTIILYILCPLLFIIPALIVNYCFFVPAALIAFFGFIHFLFAQKQYKKALSSFLNNFGCISKDEYYKKIEERASLVQTLRTLLDKKDIDSAKKYSEQARLKSEIDSINQRMLTLVDMIVSAKNNLSSVSTRPYEEILSDLEYYRDMHNSLTQKLSALDCAIEAINHAKDYLSKHLSPAVSKKAMEYLNLIAPKESRNISLNENFELYLTDPMPQSILSCSFGLKQEVYLCFRIALSEFLYGKDMPLILDDPFLGSDDYRENALIDLFSHLSRDRQVIIFTNRLNPRYNQIGCNFIDITG